VQLVRRRTTTDLIFGVGLVGAWVADAAKKLPGLVNDRSIPTNWNDLDDSLEEVKRALHTERVRVFWCAGRAGFSSSAVDCDEELKSLEKLLAWSEQLGVPTEFHLTSSAGGLHEGMLLVSSADQVTTERPYAALKLKQEKVLVASSITSKFTYRISTVYGPPAPQRRLGLVSTMVLNALRQKPTLITAEASTLRDFVSAVDVGSFIAREEKPTGLHYLVTGKPLSVWALQLAVERVLQRPVRVSYSVRKDNVASTSFSPSLKPPLWEASSVEANLPLIAAAAQSWAV
jgi:nucleoside-diphosphate-sugar epimerase